MEDAHLVRGRRVGVSCGLEAQSGSATNAAACNARCRDTYKGIVEEAEARPIKLEEVERFAFYEEAKKAYAVVSTGEGALYANIILRKGVIGDTGSEAGSGGGGGGAGAAAKGGAGHPSSKVE